MNGKWTLILSVFLALIAACPAAGQGGPRRPDEKRRPEQKQFDSARLFEQFDKNNDGQLDRTEVPERMKERFERIDTNGDGKLSREDVQRVVPRLGGPPPAAPSDPLFGRLDINGDGRLSKMELQNAAGLLETLDRNKDGSLDREELVVPTKKGNGRPGEVITPPARAERVADRLQVGDAAPNFTLPLVNGKGEVTLSVFKGVKPVVLIFASYT